MYPLSRSSNIDQVTCLVGGVTLAANPQHTVARLTHRVEDTVKEWRCKRTWTIGSEAGLSNLPEDLGTLASISVFFTGRGGQSVRPGWKRNRVISNTVSDDPGLGAGQA